MLYRKITSDVASVAGSRVIRQGALVAMMAVAARFLDQQQLGVWALLYIVIQFSNLLSDSGISTYVVRQKQLDQRTYATAFYMAAGLAISVTLLVAIVGAALAEALNAGGYRWHIALASLAILPMSIGGVLQAKLRRECRFEWILVADVVGSTALLLTALAMLMHQMGVWAVLVPIIVGSTVSATLASLVLGLPRPEWGKQEAKSIVDYAIGLLGFSTVNYCARNADQMLIGRFLGAAPLGVYAFAYRIMMLPLSQITVTAHTVALPYMSPHQQNHAKLRQQMKAVTVAVGMLTTLPMIWAWLQRDVLVRLALGPNWDGVADLLQVFAPLAILQVLVSPIGLCFHVTGATRKLFRIGLLNTAVMIASFVIGIWWGSVLGVAVAYALANVVMVPVMIGSGMRLIGGRLQDWLRWCLPFAGCLAVSWLLEPALHADDNPWVSLMLTVIATSLVCSPLYLWSLQQIWPRRIASQAAPVS